MNKVLVILSVMLSIFFLGCSEKQTFDDPIVYYYPKLQTSYEQDGGFLSPEQREDSGVSLHAVVSSLLKGPLDNIHRNPFPEDVKLIDCQMQGDTILLTLSDRYAYLSGVGLTVANGCIAKTLIEHFGVDRIVISCESLPLDREKQIVITSADLLFIDQSTGPNTELSPALQGA